jgi:hypothetical protein
VNTLEGAAPAGSQRHATIHQHTQNNDADTSAAPGDESAGVGELRSDAPTASNTVTAVKVKVSKQLGVHIELELVSTSHRYFVSLYLGVLSAVCFLCACFRSYRLIFTQGCERGGQPAPQSSIGTRGKEGSMNQPVSMLLCLLKKLSKCLTQEAVR